LGRRLTPSKVQAARRTRGDLRSTDIRSSPESQTDNNSATRPRRRYPPGRTPRLCWRQERVTERAHTQGEVARHPARTSDLSCWNADSRHPAAVARVASRDVGDVVLGDGDGRCGDLLSFAVSRALIDFLGGLNLRRRQTGRIFCSDALQAVSRASRCIGPGSGIKLRLACRQVVDNAVCDPSSASQVCSKAVCRRAWSAAGNAGFKTGPGG
jgi:hypothetical protein